MEKTLKITAIVFGVMILVFFSSVFLLARSMHKQRTCQWANIDNVELHAGVDIPKISHCDCTFDEISNVKKNAFFIDKSKVSISNYIQNNNLKKLPAGTTPFNNLLNLPSGLSSKTNSLYYRQGTKNGETWNILLDSANAKLWVTIDFAD